MPKILSRLSLLPLLLAASLLSACAGARDPHVPAPPASEYAALAQSIQDLGPGVDPEEARRMARISLDYPRELAVAWNVTDPAYIHNIKVNNGTRPRGLCYQWADDLQARLEQENFRTLDLHRGIANALKTFRIEHSSVIVSQKGGTMKEGIVLDPWRFGGELYWGPVVDDHKYPWVERQEVFATKRALRLQEG